MAEEDAGKRSRGKAAFERVMTFPAPPLEGDLFYDTTLDHLFAELWSRPGLGVRERRLVTLTLLMAMGHEGNLKLHLAAALRSGDLTDAELDELVLHVAHYGGWPAAAVASQVLRQVRTERAREAKGE